MWIVFCCAFPYCFGYVTGIKWMSPMNLWTLARHLQNRKTFSGMRSHMRNHMATIRHIHRSPCPRKTPKRTEINMSLPARAPDQTEIVLQHHNYRKVHRVNVSAVLIVLGIIHIREFGWRIVNSRSMLKFDCSKLNGSKAPSLNWTKMV